MSFWDKINPFSGNGLLSGHSKIPIAGDVLNGVTNFAGNVINPGGEANKDAKSATQAWQGLQVPGTAGLTFGEHAADPTNPAEAAAAAAAEARGEAPPMIQGDISPYEVGDPESFQKESFLSPEAAQKNRLPYSSAWTGQSSAYDTLGPSAFKDATSAYSSLGPSAASDLAFDKGALGYEQGGADYFRNLSTTGSDPIAEADYQARAMQAEQSRKANTDAALAAAEAKGQGNAGGNLEARLMGAQASANDRYQAGLDVTAAAAKRRDDAAKSAADIGSTMGNDILNGDKAHDELVDKYELLKSQGLDDFQAKKLSGLDDYNEKVALGKDKFAFAKNNATDAWGNNRINDWYNVQRENTNNANKVAYDNWVRHNSVSDTNTGLQNDTNTFNKVTAPQQNFANNVTKTSGVTGALNNQGQTSLAANQAQINNAKTIAGAVAGGVQGGAAGAAAGASAPSSGASPWATPPSAAYTPANPYGPTPGQPPVVDPWGG